MRFSERVVFVSGGSHGIGRATVERLVAEGARVALADLDPAVALEWTAAQGIDEDLLVLGVDVRDRRSVDEAVAACVQHFGRLDTLVTVAGGSLGLSGVEYVADDDWDRELDLNLTGTMRCIRAAMIR